MINPNKLDDDVLKIDFDVLLLFIEFNKFVFVSFILLENVENLVVLT